MNLIKEDVDRDSMQPGCRYHVTFRDCGLEGEFTARFLGWGRRDWDDSESSDEGVITTGIGLEDGAEFSIWDNGLRLGPVDGYWSVYEL
jgi:hypothetical protein